MTVMLLGIAAAIALKFHPLPVSELFSSIDSLSGSEDGAFSGSADAEDGGWQLLLVNRENPLPEGYQIELTELSNGEKVDSRIYPALQQMFDDMRADGIYPVVVSGYRTGQQQQEILDDKVESYRQQGYSDADALALAKDWVAIPGTSEHQTGLAVDINADGIHSAGYEVYGWLLDHADAYGFIKRYPEDKTELTGIANEPWHYRYVGKKAAAKITKKGLCLEEYLG